MEEDNKTVETAGESLRESLRLQRGFSAHALSWEENVTPERKKREEMKPLFEGGPIVLSG